jgi:hypothetical protein
MENFERDSLTRLWRPADVDIETKRFVLSLHHCDRNENKKEFVQKQQEKNQNQTK